MPSLVRYTDQYEEPATALPVELPNLNTNDVTLGGQGVPTRITVRPSVSEVKKEDTVGLTETAQKIANKLFGLGGEERYQLWPEKLIREAITTPGDVAAGKIPQWQVDPNTGDVHTSPQMVEGAQAVSALAGSGGLASVTDATLGSAPFLRPALKYKDKLYKGKEGQQHLDVLPNELYPDFQRKAMSGEDINDYKFGFYNDKGQFLSREDALSYGINTGLIDPQAGKYGALTSTLLADSSKPGTAIEAMAKTKTPEFKNWFKDSKVVDADGNPLVVYHGTAREFEVFDNKKTGQHDRGLWGRGHYLTSSPETASSYASRQGDGARVIPAHVSLQNPLILKTGKDLITRLPDGTNTRDLIGPNLDGSKIKEIATSAGNDGVIQFLPDGTIGDIVVFSPEQIKSSIGNNGKFNPNNPNILMADSSKESAAIQANKPTFYSALEHQVNNITQPKMTGDQWLGTLGNKPGVKPEELDWTGLKDFLAEKGKQPVTKQEVNDYLAVNKVELKEVNKGNPLTKEEQEWLDDAHNRRLDSKEAAKYEELNAKSQSGSNTKYHNYQLPGGENYREMLLTLPNKQQRHYEYEWFDPATQKSKQFKTEAEAKADAPEGAIVGPKEIATTNEAYHSSHWDEPNILAHVRMNDRTIDGKKSLHLEEIQSDLHQTGRDKGYRDSKTVAAIERLKQNKQTDEDMVLLQKLQDKGISTSDYMRDGVPDAPFKKTWHELAIKRMLREAAEKGYDRLSWTPGEAQAARYDLSKQVDKIAVPMVNESGTRSVRIDAKGQTPFKLMVDKNGIVEGQGASSSQFSGKPLSDVVGKEMAEKIMKLDKPNEFSGEGLKIGGEGMKGFYDKIIPNAIEKLTKGHGVKVKHGEAITHKGYPETISVMDKDGHHVKDFKTIDEARKYLADPANGVRGGRIKGNKEVAPKTEPIYYIDIPQSLKDQVLRKGQPLFSNAHPGFSFIPVDYNPFEDQTK